MSTTRRPQWTILIATLAAGLLFATSPTWATILTFDIDNPPGTSVPNGSSMATYPTYGDNVSTTSVSAPPYTFGYLQGNDWTPNVSTVFSVDAGSGPLSTWDVTGGGAWLQSIYRSSPNLGSSFFAFTPISSYKVKINSFTFQLWSPASPISSGVWRVRQDTTTGGILASGLWATIAANTSLMTVDTSAAGFYNGTLVLQIEQTAGGAGANGHVAFDNINFDEQAPVPEPSTLTLLGLAVTGIAIKTRRRRRTV